MLMLMLMLMVHTCADADKFGGQASKVAMRDIACANDIICKGGQGPAWRHDPTCNSYAELTSSSECSLFSNHQARNQLVTPGIARRQDLLAGNLMNRC
ncbi:hypothetical protein F4818DRAFT_431434 [Hypoxylon cercidicola]|nr:hypothetical protein F4818DRAFT_431434 [Hypoxylon cercidicola]